LSSELKSLKDQKDSLFKKLQYEKQIKILLLLVSIFLFLTLFFVWINNI
jgi:flagellar biosynthesis/type III secretory pathway M-ring protein FliF/YscJ